MRKNSQVKTFGQQVLSFLTTLQFDKAPEGITVMHPYHDPETVAACRQFYDRYFGDVNKRWMIIGINPGRFGGGTTGIPFTDPIRLEKSCGIGNPWPKKQELSSLFIYDMIAAYGGPEVFYGNFYVTAVSPLGFTRHNKNLNYYDDKLLLREIMPFARKCLLEQMRFGIHDAAVFCLGDGKNAAWLRKLNDELQLFKSVVALPHPRFIMQYRLKKKEEYIHRYLEALKAIPLHGDKPGAS